MYIITVQLKVKEDKIDAFLEQSLDNAAKARKEPGCLRFDVLRNEKEPARFFFYEVYRSPEAHQAHRETKHYLAWREGVGDMMAEPRVGDRFLNVSPADADWA